MGDLLARAWESLGAVKFGALGAILRVIIEPPETRKEALRLIAAGIICSIAAILAAQLWFPAGENFAAMAAGFLGAVLAPRVLNWARDASLGEIAETLARIFARLPRRERPPDPPPPDDPPLPGPDDPDQPAR